MTAIINSVKCINKSVLLSSNACSVCHKRFNSNRTSVAKIAREVYTRMYPTILVYPNGATIKIRYHEPRKIIKLPFDLNSVSASEQMNRLKKKKPKQKIIIEEEIYDSIDVKSYLKMSKKS